MQRGNKPGRQLIMILALLIMGGCQAIPDFPAQPRRVTVTAEGGRLLSYDTDEDDRADYEQVLNRAGRKVELRFAAADGGASGAVNLDDMNGEAAPHFIIALDGVPYDLVEQLYRQGHFRLFYPPSKVISCFPCMTDLAYQRMFGGVRPLAYQAKHFDRRSNRIVPGNEIYLSGLNADWMKKLAYRCSTLLDAWAYVRPEFVFRHELRGMMEVFRQAEGGTYIVYSVGTAGLGTQGGREAIINYLRVVDRLCEQIVYERRGRVKITLLADHGHNMSGRGRVRFEEHLKEFGFRLSDRLQGPHDVVVIDYGLVTYAAFFTEEPAQVADALLQSPVVTLACYPQEGQVVVRSLDGRAVIRRAGGRYSYSTEFGDPLGLLPVIAELRRQGKVDGEGFIDDRALFEATIEHEYPDPLRRIWQAFYDLVQEPADLIVCLKDGWCHGSGVFNFLIGGASSTHGSLNQLNCATFLLTMLGETPPALRLEEVMPALGRYRAAPEESAGKIGKGLTRRN
ncbi:MAG: hypothetical protein AMJ79_13355 [Phycisphaerae bacterium SM23_30]|nr:MAG: hypothetical protein AMJ79_13355 [Phycisphaerae bacterium SM23_30]